MGYLKRRIIEALEPTMAEWDRRWIPVEERLPEAGRAVLVCWSARTGMMGVGQLRRGQWMYKYDIDDDEWAAAMQQPTHWMPLPQPPEVK